MAAAADSSLIHVRPPSWTQRLRADLQPTPGRLNAVLRIVLASVLTLLILLVLQMPFASLGLYVVFFVARDSPAASIRTAFSILLVFFLTTAIEFGVVIVSDNDPMVRLLSVVVVTFVAGLLMGASTAPFLGAAGGFIYVTVIALWETQAPPDALVRISLYLIGTVSIALGCSVAVEYAFALRHPANLLTDQVRLRYQALEAMFRLYANGAGQEQLTAAITRVTRTAVPGQAGMQELYNNIVARNLDTGDLRIGSRVRLTMLAQLMDASAAFGAIHRTPLEDAGLRERCARIADRCHDLIPRVVPNTVQPMDIPPGTGAALIDRVEFALHAILTMPAESGDASDRKLVALPASKVPFLIPGAITSSAAVAFALKISLCASLCYIFYNAVKWPGISTSVITVILTAAGNTGAIKQKMAYRLFGSAIGGFVFGIGSAVFLFPHMDTVTPLVILVAAVSFISAWFATGRQFGYVGMQIAFSFYLVAFEGATAPTDLTPPRDRLLGILVALIVMWFVFDQIWPTRTVSAMRRDLASVLKSHAKLFRLFEPGRSREIVMQQVNGLRDQVGKTVAGLRTMNEAVEYEFGADRERHMRSGQMILQAALTAVGLFWNQLAVLSNEADADFLDEPELIAMRRQLAVEMDAMAESVTRKTPYRGPDAHAFVHPMLLDSQRYGDYTRNAVARADELQAIVAGLSAQA
jgi:multidrug resistance protein MdtO